MTSSSVVKITDRPGEQHSENGDGPQPPSLAADAGVTVEHQAEAAQAAPEANAQTVMTEEAQQPPDEAGPTDDQQPVRVEGRSQALWQALGAVALIVFIIGGYLALEAYNGSLYHVDTDEGELVIYQGRNGGLLWMNPDQIERTDRFFDDLTDASRATVDGWTNFGTLKEAQLAVDNLDTQPADEDPAAEADTGTTAEDG